ncbi:MAG: hypothetical protein ACYC6V_06950 [Bacillota bacterium]
MNGLTPVGKVSTPLPSKIPAENGPNSAAAGRLSPASAEEDKLKGLCRQFESFFLNELLKRSGVFGDGGNAWDTSDEQQGAPGAGGAQDATVATQTLADEVAKMGGLGLGDVLYNYLKDTGVR